MADRETIMTWLKKCGNGGCSSRCPYDDLGPDKCYETLMTDALELLKEQELVRCKDCKHWRQLYGDKPFYSHIGCCDCDDMWRSLDGETTEVNDIRTNSDFYCGYAIRW